jgi:tetrathionate reductase subunit B
MGKVLVIDYDICNGCYNCQVACKDEHVANDWSPIAKPQPDTGQFWNKIDDKVRGQVPKVKVTYMHTICMHCQDAPCIDSCNADAIYRRDDGAVIIDPDRCRGNQLCLAACPYPGVIWWNDALNIAQKCTFCAHLLDDGWEEPRCVDACPTGAFTFGDEDDPEIKELLAKAEPLLMPGYEHVKPRVFFIGMPKPFIAGAVYDKEADLCTEGATVTATNAETGATASAETDSYGDFWLNDLEPGTYTLLVEKDGYLSQKLGPVDASDDINVGDIAVWKA